MTKKSKQKLKFLENEKSFEGEIISSFLKGFSIAKSCLRPQSPPLSTRVVLMPFF